MKNATKYRIHKTIAIIIVPILIISTLTGVFKANQKWYWEEGYKKKKQSSDFSIKNELFPIHIITQTIDAFSNKKNEYEEIVLRSENQNLYYKMVTTKKEKYLIDAYSGKIVSPISSQLAAEFATQYVKEKPKVKTVELIEKYEYRKNKEKKPTYKIAFDNDVHSEIYLDYFTGDIVEDIDDHRHFGIWVMKLHEFDFFNAKKGITIFVGIILILLALSGIWIYKIRSKKNQNIINN